MVSISRRLVSFALFVMAVLGRAGQVTLPDGGTATSTLSVHVSAQCRLAVPSTIAFTVGDTTVDTPSALATVAVRGIVLAKPTQQVKLYLKADASAFTPPMAGTPTWAASDVSWGAATWYNGMALPGTLSSTAYTAVATSNAGVAAMTTESLQFTLKANPSVVDAGVHTLQLVWKIESVTP